MQYQYDILGKGALDVGGVVVKLLALQPMQGS